MHDHIDEAYEAARDAILLCKSNQSALALAKRYPALIRHFSPQFRYYLYTVKCRENNTFANSYELWETQHA